MTDANGRAALPSQSDHVCLVAFLGDQAALRCELKDVSSARATPIYELRLEPAKTISGRVLGADGKPVAGVRLRLAIAGEQEWHFVDAEIAEDGKFRLAPVPSRLLRTPDTHIEARAPGCVEARVKIDEKAASAPVEVRFVRARILRGRLHAADAIRDATVRTSDKWHGL